EQASYDVVLMDVQMPEMDGLEASRAICARWPAAERPRIVAMTAEAMPGDREQCLAAGMDDYIAKPVTLDQLREALAKCAPLGGAAAAEARPAQASVVEAFGDAAEIAVDHDVLDQLREDLGGNARLHEVIVTFLDKTPAALASLHDAATRGDADAIRRAVHMIKGTSAILGARPGGGGGAPHAPTGEGGVGGRGVPGGPPAGAPTRRADAPLPFLSTPPPPPGAANPQKGGPPQPPPPPPRRQPNGSHPPPRR